MSKVILIGGTSSLAKTILESKNESYTFSTMGRKNCDYFCDLLSEDYDLEFPKDTEIVIHLAARLDGSTDEEIINTEKVNALGTLKVCIAAYKSNIKHLIIISSIYSMLKSNSEYYNIYALSKKHSEELASYYCNIREVPLTILRPSQIYDTKGYFSKSQPLFYHMISQAEKGKDITIYGENDALRNYIHVNDLLMILFKVMDEKIIGIYNCMFTNNIRLTEIAKAAFNIFGHGGEVIFLKDKSNIMDNIFPQDFKLYDKLQTYPQIDISKGIKRIYDYGKRRFIE